MIPLASTWADPNGNGYWMVDNGNTPGQPFYGFLNGDTSFSDTSKGGWTGTDFFHAFLFVADMNAQNVITLHDEISWGWNEPEVAAPEPASLSLALIGAGGLLGFAVRRRKAA